MSGAQPITEYPELTDVADDDLIYVVDVSDVTESPQGTSKKVTRSNFVAQPYGLLIATDTVWVTLSIPSAGVFVDVAPTTVTSAGTTADFVADVDGSMKYVGPGGNFKVTFMVALDMGSGTIGIDIRLYRNGVEFAKINSGPEVPVDSAPKYVYGDTPLETDDIVTARAANLSNSSDIRQREYYMKIEGL